MDLSGCDRNRWEAVVGMGSVKCRELLAWLRTCTFSRRTLLHGVTWNSEKMFLSFLVLQGLTKAFRNIPGVDMINVSKLNLLKLAPGGHVGRFVIWTQSAFSKLDDLYGTWRKSAKLKKGYNLPMPKMANTDLSRLLKAEEIRGVLRAPM